MATVVDPFDPLAKAREELVDLTVDDLYERHPDWAARWGPSGREACLRDIRSTLAFLETALRSDDASVFLGYARWIAILLRSRAVPIESARESFAILSESLRRRLPEDIATRARELLNEGDRALREPAPDDAPAATLSTTASRFVEALLRPDRAALDAILHDAVDAGISPADIADTLVQPAMAEVGERWARNEISVAEEHRATALAQLALARLDHRPRAARGRSVLFACVEGNLHSLGLRLVADAFEASGWRVEYLGADVPTRDLIRILQDERVDLLGLSVALPTDLATAQRTIRALRDALGPACPRIVVGGRPVREFSRGADFVRADALFPDAATSLAALD